MATWLRRVPACQCPPIHKQTVSLPDTSMLMASAYFPMLPNVVGGGAGSPSVEVRIDLLSMGPTPLQINSCRPTTKNERTV